MEKSARVMQTLFGSFANPNVISFAGGSPAPACLPIEEVHDIMDKVMTREGRGVEALQYNRPQGIPDLRQTICDTLLAPKGVQADPDDVVVVSGGLETMNLVCQLFIEPGDVILVESPTFMHCVEIFDMFQARCVPCQMDDHGLVMEDVEEKIRQYHPKMIYTVPTFQNPTGKTLPADRRRRLAEMGSAYDVIVLEDDPYRDIRYSGEDLAPIKTYDTTGNTILASSFSKIFSPGVRLGYVYAKHDYIRKICDIKTATNSHSSLLAEVACAEFFKQGLYPAHHKKICDIYRTQRDAMVLALDRYMPEGTPAHQPRWRLLHVGPTAGRHRHDRHVGRGGPRLPRGLCGGQGLLRGGWRHGKGRTSPELQRGRASPDRGGHASAGLPSPELAALGCRMGVPAFSSVRRMGPGRGSPSGI